MSRTNFGASAYRLYALLADYPDEDVQALRRIIIKVIQVRVMQREYFRTRERSVLYESKDLEKQLDELLNSPYVDQKQEVMDL